MTARRVTPRCTALFLLLAVAGGGWCQTQLLHPEPRTCRTQDNAADDSTLSQGSRNEYPAGGVLMVLAEVPAGLFGSLEIDLCPEGDAEEECLDRVPLQLADGSGTSYNLHNIPRTDKYEIPVILPDDITCPTCTLQLRVSTRHCADEDACPQTEDTFCSDITVKDIKELVKKVFRFSKSRGGSKKGPSSSKSWGWKNGLRIGKFLGRHVGTSLLDHSMNLALAPLQRMLYQNSPSQNKPPYQSMPYQGIPYQSMPYQVKPNQTMSRQVKP